jgi:hypothetical protein
MNNTTLSIDSIVTLIKSTKNVKKVIGLINDLFKTVEFEIIVDEEIENIEIDKSYTVKEIRDTRFENLETLKLSGEHIIRGFIFFVKEINDNKNFSPDEKVAHLKFLSNYFKMQSEVFNRNNYFSFISNNPFFIKIYIQRISVRFDQLKMSTDDIEYLQDSYTIRYMFYQELGLILDRALLSLEINNFGTPEIELTEVGVSALTEFIMAIENNHKYVEVDDNNPKSIQKRFSEVFGIKASLFSKKRDNLYNNKKLGIHLRKLADDIKIPLKKK